MSMPNITEIAPDLFRISIYAPALNLQFNHFLVRDEQPLLYHTGMRRMFPELRTAVAAIIDPRQLRWVGFSHFEVDECGAINEWIQEAPHATPVCGMVGALVNLEDYARRRPKALKSGETFSTGRYHFQFRATPHLPHGWDAGVLFEETQRTLFCSDLFHQDGDLEPLTESDVLGRVRQTILHYQSGPLMDYLPFTTRTEKLLHGLAELQPKTLAIMHGSSYAGNGAQALRDLSLVMREVLS